MVQIIGQEGLGDILGSGVGQGVSSALQMLVNSKIKSMQDLNDINLISKGRQNQGNIEFNEDFRPHTTEELLFSEKKVPGSAKILMAQDEKKQAEKQEKIETARIGDAANQMWKLMDATGPLNMLTLDETKRGNRQEFDTLALELEKKAADMVGKGTLNKQRFEFLKSRLPSSSKTQSQNKSALKAWNRILGLNLPQFEVKEKSNATQKIKKAEEGEALSLDLAKSFLEMAKGDKEKARKIARQHGYQF